MVTGGRGNRFAYDARTFVAFLDSETEYILDGVPARLRRSINFTPIDQDTDARSIRRWRSGRVAGVTKPAAERLLMKVGLTLGDYTAWANARRLNPILRDKR